MQGREQMVNAQSANRLANKRARKIATGMPREYSIHSNHKHRRASIMRAMITQRWHTHMDQYTRSEEKFNEVDTFSKKIQMRENNF